MKGEKEGSWCLWKSGMMEDEKERKKIKKNKKNGVEVSVGEVSVPSRPKKSVLGKEEKSKK